MEQRNGSPVPGVVEEHRISGRAVPDKLMRSTGLLRQLDVLTIERIGFAVFHDASNL
jgi:hypothetical protein